MTFQASGPAYISAVGTEAGLTLPYYARNTAILTDLCGVSGTLHLLADAYGKSIANWNAWSAVTLSSYTPYNGQAAAECRFQPDGGIDRYQYTTEYGISQAQDIRAWFLPLGEQGSGWYIRFTKVSGTTSNWGTNTPADGVWQLLDTMSSIGLTVSTTLQWKQLSCVYNVSLSPDGGTTVAYTGQVTLTVECGGTA